MYIKMKGENLMDITKKVRLYPSKTMLTILDMPKYVFQLMVYLKQNNIKSQLLSQSH